MQIEQQLEALEKQKRVNVVLESLTRTGPPHAPTFTVVFVVHDERAIGHGLRKKEAWRNAALAMIPKLEALPDPCSRIVKWTDLYGHIKNPVIRFRQPPMEWFSDPQVLGIDWEGEPRAMIQVACKSGIVIDVHDAPWVARVLSDERHTHAVFGDHETHLVASPMNVQENIHWSLAETVSRRLEPNVRFLKDKTIHERTDWQNPRACSEEALRYAAVDAIMTRRLGLKIK